MLREVNLKKFISLGLVIFALWILMAGIDPQELVLGGLVAVILSYILANYLNVQFSVMIVPKLILFIFLYIPVLIIELIKANIDVAKRVLNPKLPINPGIVKVPTSIKSDTGKLILANSITLTPGTISIDADDDSVYVHWIDVKGKPEDYQDQVSSSFEKILRRLFHD